MNEPHDTFDSHLDKAVGIVAAYVSNNSLRPSDLPELIASVHSSIRALTQGSVPASVAPPEAPAVPVKKSVTKDHIVCLEDGKKFKSLRRHLSSFHNMTPEQYRAKWDLGADYPMVAPSYSATRSRLAKDSGLGHVNRDMAEAAAIPAVDEAPAVAEPAKKATRGRPKKTA